jgi:hypothetical protein
VIRINPCRGLVLFPELRDDRRFRIRSRVRLRFYLGLCVGPGRCDFLSSLQDSGHLNVQHVGRRCARPTLSNLALSGQKISSIRSEGDSFDLYCFSRSQYAPHSAFNIRNSLPRPTEVLRRRVPCSFAFAEPSGAIDQLRHSTLGVRHLIFNLSPVFFLV